MTLPQEIKTKDPNTVCLICKIPFYCLPSRLRKGEGKYCSQSCYGIAQKRPPIVHIPNVICLICHKPFFCEETRLQRGHGKYCSRPCYTVAQSKPKSTMICQTCCQPFPYKRYKKRIRKFCSSKCMGLWRININRQRLKKICGVCKKPKNLNQFHKRTDCSDGHVSTCKRCTKMWAKDHPEQTRATACKHANKRRAKKKGAPCEDITLEEIYLRDGGVCQICYRKTLPPHQGKRNATNRATMDHIVPVSDPDFILVGHVRTNVRLAHFGCNASRNNRPGDAQYLLFG